MASLSSFSSSSSNIRHTIRSISLPTRSHHSTLQVEEEVTNLKTWEASLPSFPDAETFYNGLACLERLYTCVDNLFSLPLTQQALSLHQHEKLVNELLVRSMRLLDICGSIKDLVSQVKGHVRDIQSALRRRREDLSIDVSFLKKLKKDAKRAVADLKQIDHIYGLQLLNLDHHLSSVIRVLRDVSEVSISVFGLLLSFLSVSISKLKSTTKWSIISKLIPKGTAGSKYQPQNGVEALDCHIEGIENGLASMFRRLIRTRASLLNIQSH
ncbi:uncharacterized protein LOC112512955 [Cynara cardunculus var. scolymus]|uniref:uncharacterized protein LOC112512955 n=1 Tax=Cynara cardunculus var. scolymus TaxID=59895 RepID=UPI000D62AA54|nr:uncharacterized protein LOC112512955 [Cynara cardunculus var. scolymus]